MAFHDLSSLLGTRITDPLNKKAFIFIDVTNITSAVISMAMSVTTVDIPSYEFDIEEKAPLSEHRNYNIIKNVRPSGDLSLTRGNFVHDFYAYNLYASASRGENVSLSSSIATALKSDTFSSITGEEDWSPRRNFLLLHYSNIRWLQYLTMSMTEDDLKTDPRVMATRFLNTSAALDFSKILTSGIPGIVYLFKDCLVNNLEFSDGFDASAGELSFTNISFAVGDMRILNPLTPRFWTELTGFLND